MSSFFVCFTNWIFETNISSRILQFINQTALKHLACSYSLPPPPPPLLLKKKKIPRGILLRYYHHPGFEEFRLDNDYAQRN